MESGTNISRNHIDLEWTNLPFESQPVVSNFAKSQHAPSLNTVPSSTNANIKHSDKAKLIGKRVEASSNDNKSSTYTTCSGQLLLCNYIFTFTLHHTFTLWSSVRNPLQDFASM